MSNEEFWMHRLGDVNKYVVETAKLPSKEEKDIIIKKLGTWVSHQNNNYGKSLQIMNNPIIRKEWEDFMKKYPTLFLENDKAWMNTLNDLNTYIVKTGKLPQQRDKDTEVKKMGRWIINQNNNYGKSLNIMRNLDIRTEWENFTSKYPVLFMSMSNEEFWMHRLGDVNKYVVETAKLPSAKDKCIKIKQMGTWVGTQKYTYPNQRSIMKNPIIRKEWEDFTSKYPVLFMSNEEFWMHRLGDVNKYVVETAKLPSVKDKDTIIKELGTWVSNQKRNYPKSLQIMNNPLIRKEWEEFTSKYPTLFK